MNGERLTKAERLSRQADFAAAYKDGKSYSEKLLKVYILKNGLLVNRLGINIQKSKVRASTDRNRIRRLLKEAYRKNKKYFNTGFDVVIKIKKIEQALPKYNLLKTELVELFKKSGIA